MIVHVTALYLHQSLLAACPVLSMLSATGLQAQLSIMLAVVLQRLLHAIDVLEQQDTRTHSTCHQQ